MNKQKTALVVGAGGMVGGNMIGMLARAGGWRVLGLSRSRPALDVAFEHVACDLLDPAACRDRLGRLGDVTHLFYAALAPDPDIDRENALNERMFANLIEAFLPGARSLVHVHLLEGAKWYGYHLGPYETPAREDDPPTGAPYFYHPQEALLRKRRQGARWTWSATRPGAVCGYATASHINLATLLAVYAALLKTEGRPLDFPGNEAAWNALTFVSDVGMLNRAMLWCATDPRAADQAFNIANGDAFRWRALWPRLAAMFGMDAGRLRPASLVETMTGKDRLWDDLVARHDLRPNPLNRLVSWAYADTVFRRGWDNLLSTVKANNAGFTEMQDSEAMFRRIFGELREKRVVP